MTNLDDTIATEAADSTAADFTLRFAAISAAADRITEVPIELLLDSPFQPRIVYTDIEGLAATIRADGRIHQPLVVRPAGGAQGENVGYELVFGHRRLRAAELLNMATVPCIVRAMTDAEVRAAQMTENIQREAMRALEEARGWREQIDADNLTADDIAMRVGKSRSHVYGRLRLLSLCAEVRKALEQGEIDPESALLVARVGSVKLQEKALAYIRNGNSYRANLQDGGKASYRAVRELLNEKFTLALKDAIFDPEEEMLLPEAGHCIRCPKRSGNAPEFADLVDGKPEPYQRRNHGPDVCTDPDCFAAKKTAHLKREAAKLQAEGKVVVYGNKARAAIDSFGKLKGGYIPISEVRAAELKAKPEGQKPQILTIQDPRTGKIVKAYKQAELEAAGVKTKPAAAKGAGQQRDWQKEQREREAAAKVETERRTALLKRVRDAAAGRDWGDLERYLVTKAALAAVEENHYQASTLLELHGVTHVGALIKQADTASPRQLATLLLDCALISDVNCRHYGIDQKPEALLALAAHYGVQAATEEAA